MLQPETRTRIIHGIGATLEEFPFIVGLVGINGNETTFCGGAILSSNVIITAAHCMKHKLDNNMTKYGVMTNSAALVDKNNTIVHKVINFTVHEKYDENNVLPYYDLAILQLENPIDNKTMKTIAMLEPGQNVTDGADAITAGWGDISKEGPLSQQLQSLKVRIVGKQECEKAWNGSDWLTKIINSIYHFFTGHYYVRMNGFICTTSTDDDENKSVCQGDSGGPLVVDNKLAGITSFVKEGCQSKPLPNVFTEVSYYRQWIDERVAEFTKN